MAGRFIVLYVILQMTQCVWGQTSVFETKFPLSNVKNCYVVKNRDKEEYLLQAYRHTQVYLQVLDAAYGTKFETEELFEFPTYEYITTFQQDNIYYMLYKNEGELSFGILDITKEKPYRFLKIGSFMDKYSEVILSFRELDNKCIFITYNQKKKKLNCITVTHKGISERTVYDAPQKIEYAYDNFWIASIYDDRPQELSLAKNSLKNYEHGNKYLFGARGFIGKSKEPCTKFLDFDKELKQFSYREIPDSMICGYFGKLNNTNYTFNDGKIYFVNLNAERISLLVLDALDFHVVYRREFGTDTVSTFNVRRLFKDGETNVTGNDFYLTDTVFNAPGALFDDLFESYRKLSNITFKVAVAVNTAGGKDYYSIGVVRQTYFRSNIQQLGDMFNVPMGSVSEPTNFTFRKIFNPYFPKDNGINFQTRYFLATVENNCLTDTEPDRHPNGVIRKNVQHITALNPEIKEMLLNDFGDGYYINIINKKDKMLGIYRLTK